MFVNTFKISNPDPNNPNLGNSVLEELVSSDFYSLISSYLNALDLEERHFVVNQRLDVEYSFDFELSE